MGLPTILDQPFESSIPSLNQLLLGLPTIFDHRSPTSFDHHYHHSPVESSILCPRKPPAKDAPPEKRAMEKFFSGPVFRFYQARGRAGCRVGAPFWRTPTSKGWHSWVCLGCSIGVLLGSFCGQYIDGFRGFSLRMIYQRNPCTARDASHNSSQSVGRRINCSGTVGIHLESKHVAPCHMRVEQM